MDFGWGFPIFVLGMLLGLLVAHALDTFLETEEGDE